MCRVEGCRGSRGSTGLCADHYAADLARRALERFGPRRRTWPKPAPEPAAPTAPPAPVARPGCSADGCDRDAYARGLCSKHWQRARIAGKPLCAVDGCRLNQLAKGLCGTHYRASRKSKETA